MRDGHDWKGDDINVIKSHSDNFAYYKNILVAFFLFSELLVALAVVPVKKGPLFDDQVDENNNSNDHVAEGGEEDEEIEQVLWSEIGGKGCCKAFIRVVEIVDQVKQYDDAADNPHHQKHVLFIFH